MLPADLLDLIAPASAGACTPAERVVITVGVLVGLVLLWPVVILFGLAGGVCRDRLRVGRQYADPSALGE
jgi:hypothetical protein